MDIAGRITAIIIELIVFAVLFYCILIGVKLLIFDVGAPKKYSNIINVSLIAVGSILMVFVISHLTAFYP